MYTKPERVNRTYVYLFSAPILSIDSEPEVSDSRRLVQIASLLYVFPAGSVQLYAHSMETARRRVG